MKYISLSIFLISFAVGLFFVYVLGPDMKTVFIYPSPDNVDKVLFQDKADNCFSFTPEEVKCPTDKSLIHDLPVQG
jgi:hypothetical protein